MKIDENFASIHSYLCSDGHVTSLPNRYSVSFTNINKKLINDFKDKFEKVFKIKLKMYYKDYKKENWSPIYSCCVNRKAIHEKLIKYGPYYSHNWKIPKGLFSNKELGYWLRAYFDSEGWLELKEGQNRRIGMDCINYEGILEIKKMLKEDFGIDSILKKKNKRKVFRLCIFGEDNLVRFQEKIGFLHDKKKRLLKQIVNSFFEYGWFFPEDKNKLKKFIKNLMKEKGKSKIRKGEVIRFRISSVTKFNLEKFSSILKEIYNIESKIFGPSFNGYGTEYYELSIHKIDSIKKVIQNKLLNKLEKKKITNSSKYKNLNKDHTSSGI